jgi:hypothetical protein
MFGTAHYVSESGTLPARIIDVNQRPPVELGV